MRRLEYRFNCNKSKAELIKGFHRSHHFPQYVGLSLGQVRVMLYEQEKIHVINTFHVRIVRKVLLKKTALHDSCIVRITKKWLKLLQKIQTKQ